MLQSAHKVAFEHAATLCEIHSFVLWGFCAPEILSFVQPEDIFKDFLNKEARKY